MSSRIFSFALLLGACGQGATDTTAVPREAGRDARIDCAVGGSDVFERVCVVERAVDAEGALELTVRGPDGGFRRLLVTKDGRGVTAADGAEAATVRVVNRGEIEVTLAGDRYRLPATIR